jgi:Lrp/AsnC family transcriptional regulator, regulator for asnA, asnC and gidA
MEGPALTVDALDRKIMALLREDGRMSYKRIAREVNLSETAVRHRVARMLRDKVFRISTVISPIDLGLIGASVDLRVRGSQVKEVTEAIARLPEADWVAVTSGRRNVSVELECPDPEAIYAAVAVMEALEGVEETEVRIYLHVVKHTLAF